MIHEAVSDVIETIRDEGDQFSITYANRLEAMVIDKTGNVFGSFLGTIGRIDNDRIIRIRIGQSGGIRFLILEFTVGSANRMRLAIGHFEHAIPDGTEDAVCRINDIYVENRKRHLKAAKRTARK